jgi:hypothetical protein
MRVGTKSLLFGIHQFALHPWSVTIAWRCLYGRWPNWRELVCIIVHDWGYWGAPNMDGSEGARHPELGARIAGKLFGEEYWELVLLHSRHYAKLTGQQPSLLCWADKLSMCFESWWSYILRGKLSGEIDEYMEITRASGAIPEDAGYVDWLLHMKRYMLALALEQDPNAMPYTKEG